MWAVPISSDYCGLIRRGDEPWLDDLEDVEITKSCCLGGTLIAKYGAAPNIEFRRSDFSSYLCGSYQAFTEGETEPLATFNSTGACGCATRHIMCPPGREVINAAIHKVWYGNAASGTTFSRSHYTSYLRGGVGILISRELDLGYCWNKIPVVDGMGRVLANIDSQSCCASWKCCGTLIRVKFDRDATSTDKLAVLDWALAIVDRSMSNPSNWLVFLLLFLLITGFVIYRNVANNEERDTPLRSSTTPPGSSL